MRIISEVHDYYDPVQRMGQDLTCVWVRKLKKFEFDNRQPNREWIFPHWHYGRYTKYGIDIQEFIIGFCGTIYPVIKINNEYFYNLEDFEEYVLKHDNKDTKKILEKILKKSRWQKRLNIQYFFEECEAQKNSFSKLFIENKSPVFVAECKEWWSNDEHPIVFHGISKDHKLNLIPAQLDRKEASEYTLKNLKFFKVFDTQAAFQEIHSYLSGVLGFNNPDIPEISDKDMRDIKGFNNMSFKKEKSKKR